MTADGPVRVIDAFVEGLDVSGLGFGRTVQAGTRRPYDPRDLLKLYVYGRRQPNLLGCVVAKDALSELDLDGLRGGGEGSGFGDDHDKDSSAGFGRGDGCAIGAGRSKRDS